MKLPARIVLIVGLVILAGAIGVLSYGGFEVWRQFLALDALRSREFANPLGIMIGGAVLTLVAGAHLGFALALPRNPKQPREVTPPAATPSSSPEQSPMPTTEPNDQR